MVLIKTELPMTKSIHLKTANYILEGFRRKNFNVFTTTPHIILWEAVIRLGNISNSTILGTFVLWVLKKNPYPSYVLISVNFDTYEHALC